MFNYKAIKANTNTTTTGVLSLIATLVIVLASAFQEYLAGNGIDVAKYLTTENIAVVYGIIVGLQGVFGRDADKSSQDSGVREPLPEETHEAVAPTTRDLIEDQFSGNVN